MVVRRVLPAPRAGHCSMFLRTVESPRNSGRFRISAVRAFGTVERMRWFALDSRPPWSRRSAPSNECDGSGWMRAGSAPNSLAPSNQSRRDRARRPAQPQFVRHRRTKAVETGSAAGSAAIRSAPSNQSRRDGLGGWLAAIRSAPSNQSRRDGLGGRLNRNSFGTVEPKPSGGGSAAGSARIRSAPSNQSRRDSAGRLAQPQFVRQPSPWSLGTTLRAGPPQDGRAGAVLELAEVLPEHGCKLACLPVVGVGVWPRGSRLEDAGGHLRTARRHLEPEYGSVTVGTPARAPLSAARTNCRVCAMFMRCPMPNGPPVQPVFTSQTGTSWRSRRSPAWLRSRSGGAA